MTTEIRNHILEDMLTNDLIALYATINNELPEDSGDLAGHHASQLAELDAIQTELEKR